MAFNPFRAFRKHQKVLFAALTIMCMITFVLAGSSGVFQEITGWFGGGGRSPQVAILYGKPVYAHELVQLRQQRELANLFMINAIYQARDSACQQIAEDAKKSKLPDKTKQELEQLISTRRLWFSLPGFKKDQLQQQISTIYRQLMMLHPELPQSESGATDLIQRFQSILIQDFELLQRPGQWYFGDSRNNQDLLDFMIWQRQADRLGIQLNLEDLAALIRQETRNPFTQQDNRKVQGELLRRYRDLRPEMLSSALAAEFRARLAQDAILGVPVMDYAQYLPSLTPYDFWNFYREQRAESTLALLPIPVASADFLHAAGEPTEKDLTTLYDQAKDRKYNPANPEAGFKQPTRVLLEWVSAEPDSPHYKRAAEFAVAATQATLPLAYDLTLRAEYDNSLKYSFPSPSWNNDDFRLLHDSSVNRPQNVAAAVGQALGAGATLGPAALSGWTAYQGSAVYYEFQDRLRHERKMILGWLGGSPWITAALTCEASPKTEFLPLEQIKPFVLDKYKEKVAQKLASNALDEVEKDLRNLSHYKPEFASAQEDIDRQRSAAGIVFGHAMGPAAPLATAGLVYQQQLGLARARARAASAFAFANTSRAAPLGMAALVYRDQSLVLQDLGKRVAENIDKYALKHGQAEQMRDQFDLGNDPGLEPLKKSWIDRFGPDTRNTFFGEGVLARVEHGNLYDPQEVGTPDRFPRSLYWKTKDRAEYVPPFDEVKETVRMRWKFEKARALARQEAEEIVKWLPKGTSGPDVQRALNDPKRADKPNDRTHGGKVFELNQVARLVPGRVAVPSRDQPADYHEYQIPQANVEYASPEMVKQLLDLKEPGTAVVLHDKPEANYYVAVLVHRSPTFEMAFNHDAGQPQTLRTLLSQFEKDTKFREKQREALLKQLRAEAIRDPDEEYLQKGAPGTRDEE
jgi:hypothetical protein